MGVESRAPSDLYLRLVNQALRHGMPASRRHPAVWRTLARYGLPQQLASLSRYAPRSDAPELDQHLDALRGSWDELRTLDSGLTRDPTRLSALCIERSVASTLFVFADDRESPDLVSKLPRPTYEDQVARESKALLAAGEHLAPRFLGTVGDGWVQEAVGGEPLALAPLAGGVTAQVEWPHELDNLTSKLQQLASVTTQIAWPAELDAPLEAVRSYPGLSTGCRRAIAAAAQDLRSAPRAVLTHGDTSPQNCLVSDGDVRLIDWEMSRDAGCPGFDAMNAAMSFVEHRLALRDWAGESIVKLLEDGWTSSVYFDRTRSALADSLDAAEVPGSKAEQVALLFFVVQLGRVLLAAAPRHPVQPEVLARRVEIVARS